MTADPLLSRGRGCPTGSNSMVAAHAGGVEAPRSFTSRDRPLDPIDPERPGRELRSTQLPVRTVFGGSSERVYRVRASHAPGSARAYPSRAGAVNAQSSSPSRNVTRGRIRSCRPRRRIRSATRVLPSRQKDGYGVRRSLACRFQDLGQTPRQTQKLKDSSRLPAF
jgi:hypothetical protein